MLPEQVEPRLRGRFGRPYLWADECESTQELARPLPEGGVAACDRQLQGRGRRGRTWQAEAGTGLLFSLARELEGLSNDQRHVMVMKDVLALSYEEIADVLEMPVGTVKCHAHRGRARMRRALEPPAEAVPA